MLVLHFDRRWAARFPEPYSEKLASLLERQLAMLTGLHLGGDGRFIFAVANGVQRLRRGVFVATGDLIGPDSCGHTAEIMWEEEVGAPGCAAWTGLPVPELVSSYQRVRPKVIRMRGLPFRVEWRQWWETHLPDLYVEITFARKPSRSVGQKLEATFGAIHPGHVSLDSVGTRISAHLKVGFHDPTQATIRQLIRAIATVHSTCEVRGVVVGVEGGGKSALVGRGALSMGSDADGAAGRRES